jgi:hypothetical protein
MTSNEPGNRGDEGDEGEAERARRKQAFYRFRVATLLLILLGVLLYAGKDIRQRRARNEWMRSLEVAIVLVRLGNPPAAAAGAIKARVPALATRLGDEMRRYQPVAPRPFLFQAFGPVTADGPPPATPGPEAGLSGAARYTYDLWRYLHDLDAQAGLSPRDFDARIYVIMRPPGSEQNAIEGMGEQGGRVGIVELQIDDGMADFALFVAAHELFHTLGASDKYNPDGSVMIPGGLADPTAQPRYPQSYAELMARHRPTDATHSVPPASLDDLAIGPVTAREIGWSGAPP